MVGFAVDPEAFTQPSSTFAPPASVALRVPPLSVGLGASRRFRSRPATVRHAPAKTDKLRKINARTRTSLDLRGPTYGSAADSDPSILLSTSAEVLRPHVPPLNRARVVDALPSASIWRRARLSDLPEAAAGARDMPGRYSADCSARFVVWRSASHATVRRHDALGSSRRPSVLRRIVWMRGARRNVCCRSEQHGEPQSVPFDDDEDQGV